MTQPLSLLVATDLSALSRHAALRAAMLARETGGTLTLVHVLETPGLVALRRLLGQAEADLEQRLATQAGDTLTELAQQIARQHAIDAPWHLSPGPIVAGINALFVTDWYSETNELLTREAAPVRNANYVRDRVAAQVVPSGPSFDGENNLRLFNSLLYAAQERIMICSPYFVPDESMLYAITTAAQSGLDVQLFVSEIGDQPLVYHAQRSYYEELLKAGVRIWLYRSPTVLHPKHLTIDDQVAVIGSSNMDMRSFSLNLEISVMVRGHGIVRELRQIEEGYRAHSRELILEEWLQRPVFSQVLDNVARLSSAVQ